ncbi:MAG TPA: hypothetical protein V6C86_13355 [Oculatellaceae cyanobacterium]
MKAKLPAWARIIIAFSVASIVGVLYTAIRSVSLLQQAARESLDPSKQKAIAHHVADFPDPLPAGFSIDKALSIAIPLVPSSGKDILVVKHVPDNLSIQLFSDPLSGQVETLEPREYLDRAMEVGGGSYLTPKIQAVKSKGQTTIAGQEMAYIVGEFKDPKDVDERKVEGMIGCICVKEKKKTILITALEPFGTSFNLDTVMTLLKSAKSF